MLLTCPQFSRPLRRAGTGLRRFLFVAPFSLALFFLAFAPVAAKALDRVTFVTASGAHAFLVEVAANSEERGKGLMYRKSLAANRGMLFIFPDEDIHMMWMKNTYISLDMVFVSQRGVVVSLAEGTEPLSLETISSGAPALAVIELKAGTARRIGLAVGDEVRHPAFDTMK